MTHKFDLKNAEIKAILIIAQPSEDVKTKLPEGVEAKVVKEKDFYDDLDDGMDEFADSLGGKDNKNKPLIGESGP